MLEASSVGTLQARHAAGVVALATDLRLLHVCHSLLHGLQHLGLHDQHLLQCWRWRRVSIVVVVVLVGTTVASVGHLMTVKRFEIEIGIKDNDKRFPTICIKVYR
jgi:hypothetical protein